MHFLLLRRSDRCVGSRARQTMVRPMSIPTLVGAVAHLSTFGAVTKLLRRFCRRRIRVEDDNASVTNFIPQDWRQFCCDILHHSSSDHWNLYHCCIPFPLFIQMRISLKHTMVCTQLSLFLHTDRQTVGVFSSDKSVSPPVTNHLFFVIIYQVPYEASHWPSSNDNLWHLWNTKKTLNRQWIPSIHDAIRGPLGRRTIA